MSELNGKYAPRPGHIPGVAVNLGGHVLVLAPLGIRLTREFQARAKEAKGEDDHLALGIDMVHASLSRNYEITREEVEALIDSANLVEASNAIGTQSGLKRVTPGEIQPAS